MEKCVLVSLLAILMILFIISSYGYSKEMMIATKKWIKYNDSGSISITVEGIDKDGDYCSKGRTISRKNFFPNGYIYPGGKNVLRWYGCQLIHEKEGLYYVVGYCSVSIYEGVDGIKLDIHPAFLFPWGFDVKKQKFYFDIDYRGKCPGIDAMDVIPLSLRHVKEKMIYDKINGNVENILQLNSEQLSQKEVYEEIFEVNQFE